MLLPPPPLAPLPPLSPQLLKPLLLPQRGTESPNLLLQLLPLRRLQPELLLLLILLVLPLLLLLLRMPPPLLPLPLHPPPRASSKSPNLPPFLSPLRRLPLEPALLLIPPPPPLLSPMPLLALLVLAGIGLGAHQGLHRRIRWIAKAGTFFTNLYDFVYTYCRLLICMHFPNHTNSYHEFVSSYEFRNYEFAC
jgi:hypothetical protein